KTRLQQSSTLLPTTPLFRSEYLGTGFRPVEQAYEPPAIKDSDAVGQGEHLVEVCGHQQDGPSCLTSPAQLRVDELDRAHVHAAGDRKSTRLNSSHVKISYAV